jgi:tetratricopeptide (TPR) repeat protein
MPLGLKPGEQLVANRAIDAESYDQYLRGKAALGRARFGYAEQLAILEPVVAKNPKYAPAWAALARAYRFTVLAGPLTSREEYDRWRAIYEPKMLTASHRAAELDPDSADVQVTLGITELGPRRWILAEDLLSKALALDPNHGEALSFYSGVLLAVGRVKEAVAMKEWLDQLEPYVPLYVGNLGEALWVEGKNDAAIAVLKQNLGRQGAGAAMGLSRIYASLGQYTEAADALSLVVPVSPAGMNLASEAARLLRSASTQTASQENLPRFPIQGSFVYLHVGAPERALEPYEEGISTGSDVGILWHPTYAAVRKTERFKKIARDLGLVTYWRERGWPEFCRPTTGDDFECD